MTATINRTDGRRVDAGLDDCEGATLEHPVADRPDAPNDRVIVVAVDGSPPSEQALRWAVEQSASTGQSIRIVTAYSLPIGGVDVPLALFDLNLDAADAARQRASGVLDRVLGDGASAAGIEHLLVAGAIDHALDQHAADAAMVVLGTRSRRRWRERLCSSTTNRITGRLDVPVISIPAGTPIASDRPRPREVN